ncbi:hypothetical protein [Cellulophaga sp. BC115SP]|uniref:hypothetical protein n=1 Tax=Cellulophaga sp. BC115SP TaxID=2683263 RepID=UPI0014130F4A|nr:hypothetical protein [Cellulophaga sp. BC115SP]NBB26744.1 hypothetical protein [Cellulophaga sp. BC115SP]
MKRATINIAVPYTVPVIPTSMRYSLKRDMFENEGEKFCEIQFEILCEKYIKMVPKLNPETGAPVLKSGKPVLEESIANFATPVNFDNGSKVIPFALYLLIEQYRATKQAELLEAINEALQGFGFEGSLADFRLSVTDVE